jgi:predicted secreted protein
MSLTTGIALYFVLWWMCFFVALPIGSRRSQIEAGEHVQGTEPGAPQRTGLPAKLIAATVGAGVLLLLTDLALAQPWLRDYWK